MTPLRKGVFSVKLTIKDGLGRWADGLGALMRRKSKDATRKIADAVTRPEPATEAQRALHQAMGWKADGWE